jgi:hypothetical protein
MRLSYLLSLGVPELPRGTSTPPSKLACRTVSLQLLIAAPASLDLPDFGVSSRVEELSYFGAVGLAEAESLFLLESVTATFELRGEID